MTRRWPLILLALPASVATWSGWVGLGELAGFGPVRPLPGISDWEINTAVTLPIGVEAYAAYALHAWLSAADVSDRTRAFARWSALGSLLLGMLGQVAYHVLTVLELRPAPWQVVTAVSCLPVMVLGMGAALGHMLGHDARSDELFTSVPPDAERKASEAALNASIEQFAEGVPDVSGYVPDPLPEALAMRAASAFLADVAMGQVPGVRQIKTELGIGQDKAQQVRAYLAGLAGT